MSEFYSFFKHTSPKIKMKGAIVFLCLVIASSNALPSSHASALDLLKELEDVVQKDGKLLMEKMVNVIHHVEDSVLRVKELVPKAYEKIHQEADQVLDDIKKVTDELQELLGKQKAMYGFDLLGSLTSLSGGTKLETVLSIMSLADKAHKVMNDAKEISPRFQEALSHMQARVESHARDFASHVLKELGLQDSQQGVVNKIGDLFMQVTEEAHFLILDLLHKMEETFTVLEEQLPAEYEKVEEEVKEVRAKIHALIVNIEQTLVMRSYSLLDLAGDASSGSSLSTAFKIMSLLDKFNKVVQDVKGFGPRAEVVLNRNVKKVADSAQVFFSHAADKLME
ncbi:hypothetical protein JTE90_022879 [Oedothorax gibbosus]|uniref:Uncharacterized protein n=1 Tax=Oedothorax gibbosus TaxID=931172 RepID=A0AAV6UTN8_9ARAC|nr:hypothetical protein JTE90_022879 [Oedothorax gibbosus]